MIDATTGAVDQNTLAVLNLPNVHQTLQREHRCVRQGRGLFEGHARWLLRPRVLPTAHILSKASEARLGEVAVHFVANRKRAHAFTDRLHDTRDIHAKHRDIGSRESKDQPIDLRLAARVAPIPVVDGRHAHSDQNLTVRRSWLRNRIEPKHVVRLAVSRQHNCFHGGCHGVPLLHIAHAHYINSHINSTPYPRTSEPDR